MTPDEQARFYNRGRDFMTDLAQLVDNLNAYAASFEARGGATALGDYGDDTLEIIYLRNDLAAFLDANKQTTLAKLRTDY